MKELSHYSRKEQRKIALDTGNIAIERATIRERLFRGWNWATKDSSLTGEDMSFQKSFKNVLPEGKVDLKNYIEEILAPKKNRVAIELGGTGSRLFSDFTPGFFECTLGVSLTDYRDKDAKREDYQREHRVIEGDILVEKTQQQVRKWLGKNKQADLIMERMHGGVYLLPNEPFFMGRQVNVWYTFLAEDGLLFADIPAAFYGIVPIWKDHVQKTTEGTVDVQIKDSHKIRLHKLPGAPREIPLLNAREILKLQNR